MAETSTLRRDTADMALSTFFDTDDVVRGLGLARFVDGSQPHATSLTIADVKDAESLVPAASATRRATDDEGGGYVLAEGPGWTASIRRHPSGHCEVDVFAVDEETLARCRADVVANAPVNEPEPDRILVQFWFLASQPSYRTRTIDAPEWTDIAANYTASTRSALDRLMALEPEPTDGRLVIWHGGAGTGKTTAARALARAWRDHHDVMFATDPDRLFGAPGYLMHVLLETGDGDRARLLVIEDADDLLRRREADRSAFARLLNVADGFVGDGLRLTILLSTNEPTTRLDPAMTRPGRCLASIEFAPLTATEATAWLGRRLPRHQPTTLAELVRLRDHPDEASEPVSAGHGTYL